jgi:hypothetical protein
MLGPHHQLKGIGYDPDIEYSHLRDDSRGRACRRPARRAFVLAVDTDTEQKEFVFWCCDLNYEEFENRFPGGRLKTLSIGDYDFAASEK